MVCGAGASKVCTVTATCKSSALRCVGSILVMRYPAIPVHRNHSNQRNMCVWVCDPQKANEIQDSCTDHTVSNRVVGIPQSCSSKHREKNGCLAPGLVLRAGCPGRMERFSTHCPHKAQSNSSCRCRPTATKGPQRHPISRSAHRPRNGPRNHIEHSAHHQAPGIKAKRSTTSPPRRKHTSRNIRTQPQHRSSTCGWGAPSQRAAAREHHTQ